MTEERHLIHIWAETEECSDRSLIIVCAAPVIPCSGNSLAEALQEDQWHPGIAEAMTIWSDYYSEETGEDRRIDDEHNLSGGWNIHYLGLLDNLQIGHVPWNQ